MTSDLVYSQLGVYKYDPVFTFESAVCLPTGKVTLIPGWGHAGQRELYHQV